MRPDTLAVMPAKKNSNRLSNKNIRLICGFPMFVFTAMRVLEADFVKAVVVDSDSDEILDIARKYGLLTHQRNPDLIGDEIPKHEIVRDAVADMEFELPFVLSVQANSPQICGSDLVACRSFFDKTVFPDSPIREVVSIGSDNIQNGAFRLMTRQACFEIGLSSYLGVFQTDYLDVHTERDYLEVRKILEG